jgi:hypothetical protein
MWLALLILFIVLCPGVVFTIPALGKKMRGKAVIAAMHAVVFIIVVKLLYVAEAFAGAVAATRGVPAEEYERAKRAAVRAKEAEARMSPPLPKAQETAKKAAYTAAAAAAEKTAEEREVYQAAERAAYAAQAAANNVTRQAGAQAAAHAAQLDAQTAALTRLQATVNSALEAQKEAKAVNAGGANSWKRVLGL